MTITTDHPLTRSGSVPAINATVGRRTANPCRRPAAPTAPEGFEAAATQHDTSGTFHQSRHRFPAYYLGRPAQTWIDALSGQVGSATPVNIAQG
jgi:hypothetical protein